MMTNLGLIKKNQFCLIQIAPFHRFISYFASKICLPAFSAVHVPLFCKSGKARVLAGTCGPKIYVDKSIARGSISEGPTFIIFAVFGHKCMAVTSFCIEQTLMGQNVLLQYSE